MTGKPLGDSTPVSPLDYEAEDDASSVQSTLSQQVRSSPRDCHLWSLHSIVRPGNCRKAPVCTFKDATCMVSRRRHQPMMMCCEGVRSCPPRKSKRPAAGQLTAAGVPEVDAA